jgi:replication factor C large subunit
LAGVAENWTEHFRPKRLSEVLGNPQAVETLRAWAAAWHQGKPEKKAVLLHGPPGAGKTSAALALATEMGWGVIELNASDVRSGPAIKRIAGAGAMHETFSDTGEFFSSTQGKRKLIILDEADNLYERGGEGATVGDENFSDRGGRRAILDTIASAHQPIVLIANDSYALTRGASAGFTKNVLVIPFRGLTAPTIQKMLASVAAKEGLRVEENVLRQIAQNAHGDARSALNDLQAIAQGLPELGPNAAGVLGERNRSETMFRALTTVFKGNDGRASGEGSFAVDETPDFVLAWLDENLPREYRDPKDLAEGYEWLSRADVFLGRVQRRQSYGLWGTATDLMSVGVTGAKSRSYGTPPGYQFPNWIRKMSASKRERELRKQVAGKIAQSFHVGHRVARMDFIPFLQTALPRVPQLAEAVLVRIDADEDEIRLLLGPDASDDVVDNVIHRVEARKQQPTAPPVQAEAEESQEPAKKGASSRSLMDF